MRSTKRLDTTSSTLPLTQNADQEIGTNEDQDWESSSSTLAGSPKRNSLSSTEVRKRLPVQPSDNPYEYFPTRRRKIGDPLPPPGFMPVFGPTKQVNPLYEELGGLVQLNVEGDFELGVLHPCPGIPRVHVLYRRNYYWVTKCSYTLLGPHGAGSRLRTKEEHHDVLKEVQKMYMRLTAKEIGGPLDGQNVLLVNCGSTRSVWGKVETSVLRPRRSDEDDNNLALIYPDSTGDGSELPDCHRFERIGFRRSTKNPDEGKGADSCFRVYLQVVSELPDGTAVVNAERETTELIKASGRSPGSDTNLSRRAGGQKRERSDEDKTVTPSAKRQKGKSKSKPRATPGKRPKCGRRAKQEPVIFDEDDEQGHTSQEHSTQEPSPRGNNPSAGITPSNEAKGAQSDHGAVETATEVADSNYDEDDDGDLYEGNEGNDDNAEDDAGIPQDPWHNFVYTGEDGDGESETEVRRRRKVARDFQMEFRQSPQSQSHPTDTPFGLNDRQSYFSDGHAVADTVTGLGFQYVSQNIEERPELLAQASAFEENLAANAHRLDSFLPYQFTDGYGDTLGHTGHHEQLPPQNHYYQSIPYQSARGLRQYVQQHHPLAFAQPEFDFSRDSVASWTIGLEGQGIPYPLQGLFDTQNSNVDQHQHPFADDLLHSRISDALSPRQEHQAHTPIDLASLGAWAAQPSSQEEQKEDISDDSWEHLVNFQA